MLSVKELKTLIKAHNKLSQIKIPPRATLEQLEKLVEDNGYKVDHEKKALKPGVKRGKQITLKKAEEITKPKPKTELQKQKEKELKEQKAEKEKKKIREAKKEAVEKFKKAEKLKAFKKNSISNNKEDMKPKQPKPTQKLKSQKEDEVRPKEKVGRPKVDPKKIKVIEPKKKSEPKKESFQGIKVGSVGGRLKSKVKNTQEVLDILNGNFNVVKQPNQSQISKIDSVFKLAEENPKYIISISVSDSRGSDPSPFDEGNIYIQPFYMDKGQNKVPADKKTFKFIKLKGEVKPKKERKYKNE